jgi:hypothetical protein
LRLFDKLLHRPTSWKLLAVIFMAWQTVVVAVLVWSYEAGFPNMISRLDGDLFGPVVDLYSFRNLALPRILAWLLCTAPVAGVMLWVYSKVGATGT